MDEREEEMLLDLMAQWEELREAGKTPTAEELCADHPTLREALQRRIERRLRIEALFEPEQSTRTPRSRSFPSGFTPHEPESFAGASVPSGKRNDDPPTELPERIGRYRIEKILGGGGFGLVYLAYDEQLSRRVAVKVPHPELAARLRDPESYLAEARALASLDHPHIVPVYDVGSTPECSCFLVSKYIDGNSLAQRMKQGKPPLPDAVRIVATVAAALHSAHKRGIVHRDIKPANILLSRGGEPFVVDFGLALREEDAKSNRRYAGTPSYMSPEQARGEAHRVDARSDVFSLGVVLYELLTGSRPFQAKSEMALLKQIAAADPKPLRQLDDRIPRELERICLKALAKRASERYSTAVDLAEDLNCFLNESGKTKILRSETPTEVSKETNLAESTSRGNGSSGSNRDAPSSNQSPPTPAITIVPKGLRSFDEHDSDFFLELLPGPRDRDGLPDSLRFWKTRIEELDPEKTFTVGLLYGPSGCGKSSLVKAGLLPRLAPKIVTIHIEATADETEIRLLNGLRKRCPFLPPDLNLADTIAALREGEGAPGTVKVLIVIDQLEQWLHANRSRQETELATALRQCDGAHVQCLAIVRDDFWMAATRFMWELEVPLVEGQNSMAVDRFPIRHARRVLRLYGQAFGVLPADEQEIEPEALAFIDQAVDGLAEDGQVVCVRLALFADMFKNRTWHPATLNAMGGTAGVGVRYLEETFSTPQAPLQHRSHQKGARAVLQALLPEAGAEIKGHMRTYAELLVLSGYAGRQPYFDDLIRILDSEVRLITPTDPEGIDATGEESTTDSSRRCYQLTHDYFVPALREWLTQKQRETARGRAQLQLADAAAAWGLRPDCRLLPSIWEFTRIRLLTERRRWNENERRMMRRAAKRHLLRFFGGFAVLAVLLLAVQWVIATKREELLKEQVATAVDAAQNNRGAAVPFVIRDLQKLPRDLVVQEISERLKHIPHNRQLGLAYARAEFGDVDLKYLYSNVLTAPVDEFENLYTAIGRADTDGRKSLADGIDHFNTRKEWQSKARVAIMTLFMGDATAADDMCRIDDRPDPVQRTLFIDEFPRWHGRLDRLLRNANRFEDRSLRSGICLALAGIPVDTLSTDEIEAWQPLLDDWYQTAPDGVTHSAAFTVLRRWNLPVAEFESTPAPILGRSWFVNSRKMTLLKISAGTFSRHRHELPDFTQEGRFPVTIEKPFFLSDREISVEDFLAFADDNSYPREDRAEEWKKRILQFKDRNYWVGKSFPVDLTNWLDATRFCNWLSIKEGRTPAYVKTGQKVKSRDGIEFDEIKLLEEATGYRLPDEAQWEYACRAGTTTPFSSGADQDLLRKYAVFRSVRIEARANRFPNPWGLFDMHGNAYEWCSNRFGPFSELRFPEPTIERQYFRVIRGGGYLDPAENCRSAYRSDLPTLDWGQGTGFRVVLPVLSE